MEAILGGSGTTGATTEKSPDLYAFLSGIASRFGVEIAGWCRERAERVVKMESDPIAFMQGSYAGGKARKARPDPLERKLGSKVGQLRKKAAIIT